LQTVTVIELIEHVNLPSGHQFILV